MHLRSLVLLLTFAVLPLHGQDQQSDSKLLSGALRKSSLPEGKESVEIPLTSTFRGLTVDIHINGKPVRLVLDTGAAATAVSPETAERLGVKARNLSARGFSASGKRFALRVAATERISLGEAWTTDEPMFIIKLPTGAAVDGVLGMGTLAVWDVRLDPAAM